MSDMKSTLKGVVRDHRLPRDYKFHFAQPSGTGVWCNNLHRYFVVRQMTKQNVATPLIILLVSHTWRSLLLLFRKMKSDMAFLLTIFVP